jgi:hypothetical protein
MVLEVPMVLEVSMMLAGRARGGAGAGRGGAGVFPMIATTYLAKEAVA